MSFDVQKKVENFFSEFKNQKFKKGTILISANQNPEYILFVKKGLVKEFTVSKKGEEIVVNIFKQNSFFPMSWAINETPNTFYFETIDEVEIYKAKKEEVLKFIKSNPDVLFDLLSRVYKGLDGIISRMIYLMSENAYDRVVIELLIHAKRFGKNEGESFKVETSEKEIAARSGLTRETVSREIKKLKAKGLVTLNKNILFIKRISALENELGES